MNLYNGDCLEVLPTFPPASVDAIITDLPYGTTAGAWDVVIPFAPMWEQVKRVLKANGVFITTSRQPFASRLIASNEKWFRQEIIWDKILAVGFLHANNRHLERHENILLFSEAQGTYNPQMTTRGKPRRKGGKSGGERELYHFYGDVQSFNNQYYPTSILEISNADRTGEKRYHPTQKRVDLYEYLIRTYTNAGETVLDICMGSGTTGVAAVQTGRNFIGIEKEQKYFEIASRRIAQAPQPLFIEPPRQPKEY
jgi:site-specific DNA-methyltransferase (adenine-specific)